MYSLLSQLGMRHKVHSALHGLCKELEDKPSVVTPTSQQLQDTLTKVLKSHDAEGETYILVDALDEIPFQTMHDERAKIAELLNTLVSSQTPRLHLLMTSRPHDDLIKSFAAREHRRADPTGVGCRTTAGLRRHPRDRRRRRGLVGRR